MSLLRFLGLKDDDRSTSKGDTETVRKIAHRLDAMPPDRARFIAAFAYILSRGARADFQISAEETAAMERIVQEHGELPEEQAVLVVQIAKTQNLLFGATEDFLVTREFARMTGHEEKLHLVDCLYAIAAAHESISVIEDNEIRQIASELGMDRRDVLAVRSRYRDHLSVLQDLPRAGTPEDPPE
jgi:uncharacterized tellurite resistance protein B-like protein